MKEWAILKLLDSINCWVFPNSLRDYQLLKVDYGLWNVTEGPAHVVVLVPH